MMHERRTVNLLIDATLENLALSRKQLIQLVLGYSQAAEDNEALERVIAVLNRVNDAYLLMRDWVETKR